MSSDKNFKKLPFGTEEFSVLRKEDYYYIDKSSYIKKVLCTYIASTGAGK